MIKFLWMILIGLIVIPNVKKRHKVIINFIGIIHVCNLTCDLCLDFIQELSISL